MQHAANKDSDWMCRLIFVWHTSEGIFSQGVVYLCMHSCYSQTLMAQTSLGPWKFIGDMGSWSH